VTSVRVVIAGPPKAGNVWLKCLLSTAYGLRVLGSGQFPERPVLDLFQRWVEQGGFPDGSVFHQHYDYSDELCDLIEAVPARAVTIIRDPYDVWVSSFFTLQRAPSDAPHRVQDGGRRAALIGKPIDHPDVLRELRRGGYRNNLSKANEWANSGRAAVVRYEDLKADPVGALGRLSAQIGSVAAERVERAVETCSAENMRRMSRSLSKHVRTATVGDSRNHLTEEHLEIFRDKYADLIRGLGYEVR
jgi:hypothetical protein